MIRTGVFTIVNGESRLSDGTLLAVCADPSPLVAARSFLLGRQCQENHWIEVSGAGGVIGGVVVFCMNDARPIATPALQPLAASVKLLKLPAAKRKNRKKPPVKGKKTSRAKPKNIKRKAKPARKKRPQ